MNGCWLVFSFALIACGGRIEDSGADASLLEAGTPDGTFIDGGLLIGSCHLDVTFTPNGMPTHPVTQADVQSTGTRTGDTFELVCSGNAPNRYHYILRAPGVAVAIGSHPAAAMLIEDPDSHNPQVGTGSCTIVVDSIAPTQLADIVTGTIVCPYLLDDPIGGYTVKGTFTVPLR